MLGVAGVLCSPMSEPQKVFFASVGDLEIEAAFLMTPPNRLIISASASDRALELAVIQLKELMPDLPGIIARNDVAKRFVERWQSKNDVVANHTTQICYRCSDAQDLKPAKGGIRHATLDDLNFLVSWALAFAADVGQNKSEDAARQKLEIGILQSQVYLWNDGLPVSMLRTTGTTPNGIRISHVYTPQDSRGQGYATSLVAEITRRQLQNGKKYCFLFADAANDSSNRLYQRIGYQPVATFHEYSFKVTVPEPGDTRTVDE